MSNPRQPKINLPGTWRACTHAFWEARIGYELTASKDWFRLWTIAQARCGPNLHAEFEEKELAKLLGRTINGTLVPMSAQRLSNLIKELRDEGLLARGSNAQCLSLPSKDYADGRKGSNKPCPTCTKKRSNPRINWSPRAIAESQTV